MGTKLVTNIKNFIISGRNQNSIKGLVKGSYPNGYRNFGPDLDKVMLPLNKKYVDASRLVENINEETGGGGGKDSYYISVLKCLVDFIQWDIKKERENYARYGMFLFLKLVESYKSHWVDPLRLTGFIRSQSEAWLSKDNSALQYFAKWILLGSMKKSLERNIHVFCRESGALDAKAYMINFGSSTGPKFVGLSENSLPIKMCTLNHKLVEMLCKCIVNISTRPDRKEGGERTWWREGLQYGSTGGRGSRLGELRNTELIEMGIVLEILLLGFFLEGNVFEERSRSLISGSLIPCLSSIIESKVVLNYGQHFHNVRYYLDENGPGRSSLHNTLRIFTEDNNLFFQGDREEPSELVESLYIRFLYVIESLSIVFSKESHEDKTVQQRYSDTISGRVASESEGDHASQTGSGSSNTVGIGYHPSNNELGLLQRFKVQDRINILPAKFKSLNDKLYSLNYYPYILTSDICLSICRGNSDYTVELITLLTCALRYYTINTEGGDTENSQRIFSNTSPFFIVDELFISISGGGDEAPRSILYYETPQYCYSLLRCLHRVLCCCPRIAGISRLVSTLVNLIDVILPLYDLNGTLCSRSKTFDGQVHAAGGSGGGGPGSRGEAGKCALLLRNAAFQVLFDIMCILSDTSQVFYVIRVLVKIRDWCGSCLLDLIRRCQRLASQTCGEASGSSQRYGSKPGGSQLKAGFLTGSQKQDRSDSRSRSGFPLFSNKMAAGETSSSEGSKLVHNASTVAGIGGWAKECGVDVDLETVNPSFWTESKILEIAGINRKWITGQIGHSSNSYMSINFSGGGLAGGGGGGVKGGGGGNMSIGGGITSGLSSDTIVSSKTTQVIYNRNEGSMGGGGSGGGSTGVGRALRADVTGGSAAKMTTGSVFGSSGCGGGASISKMTAAPSSNYCYDYSSEDEEDAYNFEDVKSSSDEDEEGGDLVRLRDGEEDEEDDSDEGRGEEDEDYWEADQKLLELIRLRPISSIINAQPPTAGILRRSTASSDLELNKGPFSKIGAISFWTKHNSAPPKTLSSMKRVCFAEVAQIY